MIDMRRMYTKKDNTSIPTNTVLFDPLSKSYFMTTSRSKVIPNTFHTNLELIMNGIDFRKCDTITNCYNCN